MSLKGHQKREHRIQIYVVDDDLSVRKSLEMLFKSVKMDVQTFEDAEVFLKTNFQDENICIICDMKMKGISGLELQKRINSKGKRVPIIFLTAFDSSELRKQAKQAGAVAYLRKPVDDQALIDTIHWALNSSRKS